ncbi:MAG: hypothetical protein PVSMB4_02190 [Ktedonobacterales bacterium]
MTQSDRTLADFSHEWETYQGLLITTLAPLTAEQLDLRAAPTLRSIGEIATHLVGARARWLHGLLGEGGAELADIATWDRPGMARRTADELVHGLEVSWQVLRDCLGRWTEADLVYKFEGTRNGEAYSLSRRWVIWHLIEHDLHHGGELSFSLGMHGLAAPDL